MQAKYEEVAKQKTEIQLQLIGVQQERVKLYEEYKGAKEELDREKNAGIDVKKALKDAEDARDGARLELIKAQGEAKATQDRIEILGKECEMLRLNSAKYEGLYEAKTRSEEIAKKQLEEKDKELESVKREIDLQKEKTAGLEKELSSQLNSAELARIDFTREKDTLQQKIADLLIEVSEEKAGKIAAEDSLKRTKEAVLDLHGKCDRLQQDAIDTNRAHKDLEYTLPPTTF